MKKKAIPDGEYIAITKMPEGSYKISPWWAFWDTKGWIKVTHEKNQTVILWTSSKDHHTPCLHGPAITITIDPKGYILAHYETRIQTRICYGYGICKKESRKAAHSLATWMRDKLQKQLVKLNTKGNTLGTQTA